MEEVRLVHSVDKPSNLRSIVKQDLRELGIKVPKQKKTKRLNQSRNSSQDGLLTSSIFGNYLSLVPSKYVADCGFVPKFIAEAAEIIEQHCHVEGIFRKSGSISRQKELKLQIEDGQKLVSENVHDVTGLIKQFFRELPDPLFTGIFHDSFVRCYSLPQPKQVEALLLLCLMLPMEHLSTLRFTMGFLLRLAAHSACNKMDAGNLAVVLAPNIMHVNSRSQKMNSAEEKLLQIQTAIVELLIQNADSIGVVSESLQQRSALMTEFFGTEDELEASDDNTLEDSKDCREQRKKHRKRSNSLQGIVNSIGRGIAKLRRSTDGKNNLTSSSNSSLTNDSQLASKAVPLSVPLTQEEPSQQPPASGLPSATPVVMRKRKMSGEVVPFSATKRKAILDQLPHKSTLGATPFTPASTKKQHFDARGTPSLKFSQKSQMAFAASPKHDANKSIRKKINLFTPSSNRKAKSVTRSKSGGSTSLCSSGLRKSGRTKQLFKRLSGGKETADEDEEENLAGSPLGVPQSQSAMELSNSDHSSLGMTRTVSSPSLHDTSTVSYSREDANTLNQGFIDADVTACLDSTTSQASGHSQQDRGRTLRRADSFKPGQKPVRRSASTDGALRRGQPNKLSNGLLEGKTENVRKLRRSFDKSDISQPIPIIVPPLPEKPHVDRMAPVGTSFCGESIRSGSSAAVSSVDEKKMGGVTSHNMSARHEETMCEMENSLLNVVLPPPSDFKDMSMMEVDNDCDENDNEGSDNESEAGFSTISGGTVIHKPPAGLHSLKAGCAQDMAHYGSSVSVTVPCQPLPLQPSCSTDSLISTASESSEAGVACPARGLDRSVSIDSGKGSLLDSTEVRASGRPLNKTNATNLQMESSMASSKGGVTPRQSSSIKSLSAEDLKAAKKAEKPAARSHSMHVGGSGKHPNIIPNLQISAETHRLLTRAGFLDSSLPPNVKDTAVPFKSPQKPDSSSHSFDREQPFSRSFRLEKSRTFRKDRSSILYSDHPSTVPEDVAMEESVIIPHVSSIHQEKMEEEVWVRREPDNGHPKSKAEETVEEVWMKQESTLPSTATEQDCEMASKGPEEVPRSAINLKRAELRLQKHDSVLHMKESNAGHVAQSVQQFNSSMDQSLDQSNNTSHSTARKRGVSPIRIPTIFAKSKTDPSAAYYRELAQKAHRKERCAFPELQEESEGQGNAAMEESKSSFLSACDNVPQGNVTDGGAVMRNTMPQKQKDATLRPTDIDLSCSLMETIEDVITPRRQKRRSQNADASRSPLQESTNVKPSTSTVRDDQLLFRTSKGLTPHQVIRYGAKGANSNRSPGKPVKRLQSPHSPHSKHSPHRSSPQKTRGQESLRLESRHFHEHY